MLRQPTKSLTKQKQHHPPSQSDHNTTSITLPHKPKLVRPKQKRSHGINLNTRHFGTLLNGTSFQSTNPTLATTTTTNPTTPKTSKTAKEINTPKESKATQAARLAEAVSSFLDEEIMAEKGTKSTKAKKAPKSPLIIEKDLGEIAKAESKVPYQRRAILRSLLDTSSIEAPPKPKKEAKAKKEGSKRTVTRTKKNIENDANQPRALLPPPVGEQYPLFLSGDGIEQKDPKQSMYQWIAEHYEDAEARYAIGTSISPFVQNTWLSHQLAYSIHQIGQAVRPQAHLTKRQMAAQTILDIDEIEFTKREGFDLKILNTSWQAMFDTATLSLYQSFLSSRIPTSHHFDMEVPAITNAFRPLAFSSIQDYTKAVYNLGIDEDSTVLLYDYNGLHGAAYAHWLLSLVGVKPTHLRILNGGWQSWIYHQLSLPIEVGRLTPPTPVIPPPGSIAWSTHSQPVRGKDKKGKKAKAAAERVEQREQNAIDAENNSSKSTDNDVKQHDNDDDVVDKNIKNDQGVEADEKNQDEKVVVEDDKVVVVEEDNEPQYRLPPGEMRIKRPIKQSIYTLAETINTDANTGEEINIKEDDKKIDDVKDRKNDKKKVVIDANDLKIDTTDEIFMKTDIVDDKTPTTDDDTELSDGNGETHKIGFRPEPHLLVQDDEMFDLAYAHHTTLSNGFIAPEMPIIIDTRPPERYSGQLREPVASQHIVGGHIPGSVNVPYSNLVQLTDTGIGIELKDPIELKKVFSKHFDLPPSKGHEIIVTSGLGTTAAVARLALLSMGYHNVRLYPNGWTIYGNRAAYPRNPRPIEVGESLYTKYTFDPSAPPPTPLY